MAVQPTNSPNRKSSDYSLLKIIAIAGCIGLMLLAVAWMVFGHAPWSLKKESLAAKPVLTNMNTLPGIRWEDSTLIFRRAKLKDIMTAVSVICKVPVQYKGIVKEVTYSGSIGCKEGVNNVMELLQAVGIPAQFDGNSIRVGV